MPSRYELVVPISRCVSRTGEENRARDFWELRGNDVDDDRWGGVARGVRGSNSCDGGRGLSSEGVGQMWRLGVCEE